MEMKDLRCSPVQPTWLYGGPIVNEECKIRDDFIGPWNACDLKRVVLRRRIRFLAKFVDKTKCRILTTGYRHYKRNVKCYVFSQKLVIFTAKT